MRMVNSEYKTYSNIRQIWYLKEYGTFIQKYLISTFYKEKIMHLPQTRKTCQNKNVLWYHTMEKHVPPPFQKIEGKHNEISHTRYFVQESSLHNINILNILNSKVIEHGSWRQRKNLQTVVLSSIVCLAWQQASDGYMICFSAEHARHAIIKITSKDVSVVNLCW